MFIAVLDVGIVRHKNLAATRQNQDVGKQQCSAKPAFCANGQLMSGDALKLKASVLEGHARFGVPNTHSLPARLHSAKNHIRNDRDDAEYTRWQHGREHRGILKKIRVGATSFTFDFGLHFLQSK